MFGAHACKDDENTRNTMLSKFQLRCGVNLSSIIEKN